MVKHICNQYSAQPCAGLFAVTVYLFLSVSHHIKQLQKDIHGVVTWQMGHRDAFGENH